MYRFSRIFPPSTHLKLSQDILRVDLKTVSSPKALFKLKGKRNALLWLAMLEGRGLRRKEKDYSTDGMLSGFLVAYYRIHPI